MRREEIFFMQERETATDVISSSDILQRRHADLRHDMKHPRPSNESVSHPGVEMRVPKSWMQLPRKVPACVISKTCREMRTRVWRSVS